MKSHDEVDGIDEDWLELTLDNESTVRRGNRFKRIPSKLSMYTSNTTNAPQEAVTYTIAKGMKQVLALTGQVKTDVDTALDKEVANLVIDHPALVGVYASEVEPGAEILTLNVVIDEKFTNGKHTKFKGRVFARGDKQSKEEYADLSTQTVNTESVFLLLAIANYEKRVLGVFDVTGAYLKADMETPGNRGLYCKINKDLADVFCRVQPNYSKMRKPDGTLFVRVDRALYGCKQSSYLWQKRLTTVLISLGFRISLYDKCVAIRGDVMVCFHVDDLLVSEW